MRNAGISDPVSHDRGPRMTQSMTTAVSFANIHPEADSRQGRHKEGGPGKCVSSLVKLKQDLNTTGAYT